MDPDSNSPSLNESEIVCEAETGIGKTLGYLLPAVLYSFKRNKPSNH